MRRLRDEGVRPVAVASTRGAWYRSWGLISIDGSTLDVADEKGNNGAFGRPGGQPRRERISEDPLRIARGERHPCPFRQPDGGLRHQQIALAKTVLPSLGKGMLCLADRGSFGFEMTLRVRTCCGESEKTSNCPAKIACRTDLI